MNPMKMTTKVSGVGTSQGASREEKSLRKVEVKNLAENIDIPKVPIPRRILIAHKKHIAAIKRVLK